jgi:hypothetical protein
MQLVQAPSLDVTEDEHYLPDLNLDSHTHRTASHTVHCLPRH